MNDVIIPAFNEEKTIANVVETARRSSLIRDVIVVSDGSSDMTAEVARYAGATVFELQPNRGKSQAMLFGFEKTNAEIILFLDADLIGFTTEHIEQLVSPVLQNACGMNVGYRDRGKFWTAIAHFFPPISGERAMRREVFEAVPRRFLKGFMAEIAINRECRQLGFRLCTVDLRGLTIRRKYQKVGWAKAVVQYLRMFFQIVSAMIRVRLEK